MVDLSKGSSSLADGTIYSKRKNFCPFSTPPVEAYVPIIGEERIERLQKIAQQLKGLKLLELNATAQGGGVAEMLYSSIPFMNVLGIEAEWKTIRGSREYFEVTKNLHNLLQGKKGFFTPEMKQTYFSTLEEYADTCPIDYDPDVVLVHDPQMLGLTHYCKKREEVWLWRCHLDVEEDTLQDNPGLWNFVTEQTEHFEATIFSAAQYISPRWRTPAFIIPPFIDPLSEKNRELKQDEIDKVLVKYQIDPKIPIIAQIGRFDSWKGIDRTLATYHQVRKVKKCQLVLAGGLASDDPEGERILADVQEKTKNDEDIHVLNLSMVNRLENWMEVNALQRAASVIMQPSTREGFGLVITEALWKSKAVIAADVGAIGLQIREGDNGYFYHTPHQTARRVIYFLEHPEAATVMGKRGRSYVEGHFLLPDRITDCIMAINMISKGTMTKKTCNNCIISFHPWFRMNKRGRL